MERDTLQLRLQDKEFHDRFVKIAGDGLLRYLEKRDADHREFMRRLFYPTWKESLLDWSFLPFYAVIELAAWAGRLIRRKK